MKNSINFHFKITIEGLDKIAFQFYTNSSKQKKIFGWVYRAVKVFPEYFFFLKSKSSSSKK